MQPGEEEALLLALACFSANITTDEFDRMGAEARAVLRENIGLSAVQFRAACVYLTFYQREFSYGLRRLRIKNECVRMNNPPQTVQ